MAILVHYESEEVIDGRVEKKKSVKKIRVNSLSVTSNIQEVAEDVVDKCKLISKSRIHLVVEVLETLVQRQQQVNGGGFGGGGEDDFRMWDDQWQEARRGEMDRFMGESRPAAMDGVVTSLDKLETYLEMLYEEAMEDKIKGTFMILQLVRDPDNLEILAANEQFLGALTRIFREEARKSMDLVINIVYIFFAFSNFSSFHEVITTYKVGDMVLKVVELEIKRDQIRKEEMEKKKKELSPEELEKENRRHKITEKKQDKLLYVCLHVLLNLAEDIGVERKMKKRGVTQILVRMLHRKSPELLLLSVTFLKKLSIFQENKDEMRESNVATQVLKLLAQKDINDATCMAGLRLLLNLSFDLEIRSQLVKEQAIGKMVELLKKPVFRQVALKLLYQISIDDKHKSMFTYTDSLPLLVNMLLSSPENNTDKTLLALAINLAANARNAEVMGAGDLLPGLITRLFHTKDPLLCKMMRNLSQHDGPLRPRLAEYAADLAVLARQSESPDLLVELLGILGNMTQGDLPFAQILIDCDMLAFLQHLLLPGASEDDIVLEIVIFIGTCVSDSRCSSIFASSPLVTQLYELMADKQEDDEIVLQITYTFFRFLQHAATRDVLLNHTQVVSYFVDLLYDKNKEIRKMADQTLDLVIEFDPEWAQQIRLRKFQIYNAEWLQA
eukprot:CAMPEP_0113720002 /NCGR_PEP_ID=MMETSP0038_2-20120614/36189_1 /TAXON_ID=2898 /ORGANISM="Cryptomonas paramecium" /LENGTH=669 /DNA_ID=CAMNT_0000648559 /DNA_START=27 /DNA_END=2033 /DNA_ORIENTATION=+ /assembly_acc=CAM_ASM_000170